MKLYNMLRLLVDLFCTACALTAITSNGVVENHTKTECSIGFQTKKGTFMSE